MQMTTKHAMLAIGIAGAVGMLFAAFFAPRGTVGMPDPSQIRITPSTNVS